MTSNDTMVVLLGGDQGGTMEIALGDHVTPFILAQRGFHFPIAAMRYTFPKGPSHSATNGAPLISVEWNDEWPEEMRERVKAIYLERHGSCPKRIIA